MFTFAAITYNHEKYILEHLESIKYQITTYGQGETFALIISDDASTDRTIDRIKGWLALNPTLFKEIEILENLQNQGITQNYLRAVRSVRTDQFKVLAGDDLYYKNDLLKVGGGSDLVFSPVIRFDREIIPDADLILLMMMRYQKPATIKKLLEYHNFIYAPGVIIKRSIAQGEGLADFLADIKWLEDYGKWYYLFHAQPDLTLSYEMKPLVLYRVNSGISTDKKHAKKTAYQQEYLRLAKAWSIKNQRFPKYLNPYRYYIELVHLRVKYLDAKLNQTLVEKLKVYEKELQGADQYLSLIRARAVEAENKAKEGENHG